nr:hypothetical protein [Actinokineospora inagensis]
MRVSYARAVRAEVQPDSVTGVEKPKPGTSGITRWNAWSAGPCTSWSIMPR